MNAVNHSDVYLDQGVCGSCWIFAVAASMESQILIHTNVTVNLSEQQLIDCDKQEKNCSGGNPFRTMNYLKTTGITFNKNYPYRNATYFNGTAGKCITNKKWFTYKIESHNEKFRIGGDENALKLLVKDLGPAVVFIQVTPNLLNYKSGIFEDITCNNTLNHIVLAVGYGTTKINNQTIDFWFVINFLNPIILDNLFSQIC